MEKYEGSIKIQFDDIPSIQLVSIKSDGDAGLLERLSLATRRRQFVLRESWQVKISGIEYHEGLNGTTEIPHKDNLGEKSKFDGASIPMPWLVSLLTLGILRPLGVMLIASIIHDYIYRNGSLRVANDGMNYKDVDVSRHIADRLFRDIIGTVNGMPIVGYIGWFFVRIGWIWVRYDKNRFGGKIPIVEYAVFILILWAVFIVGIRNFLLAFALVYIAFYLLSLVLNYSQKRNS